MTEYITAIGPYASCSGACSSRARTPASGLPSPLRTVTTNRSPTKIIMSPVSMSERLLHVAQRLQDHEHRLVVHVHLGALVALDRVLDGQRVQLEVVVDQRELGVGGVLQTDPDEALLGRPAGTPAPSAGRCTARGARRGRRPGQRSQGYVHHGAPPAARKAPGTVARGADLLAGPSWPYDRQREPGRSPDGPTAWGSTTRAAARPRRWQAAQRPPGGGLIVSSPLQRCQETSVILADALGALEVDTLQDLAECRYGAWTGAALADLAKDPLWRVVQDHPSAARFPDGEEFPGSPSPRCSCGRCGPSGRRTPPSPATTVRTPCGWRCRTAT